MENEKGSSEKISIERIRYMRIRKLIGLGLCVILVTSSTAGCGHLGSKQMKLLNVSYDPTRELYTQFNHNFMRHWEQETDEIILINQSHGGSGKQGRSVIEGLNADIVTLGLAYDIDAISDAGLIDSGWQDEFRYNSCPYTSTIVFLVRAGNPKNILDWNDLIREDVSVITPNPKSSGGARWNYLAAWGYSIDKSQGDVEEATRFIKQLYQNVVVLDSGARGAITTFTERGIGDVLIAWENEALLSVNQLGADQFNIIIPSISILTEPPVAIVDQVVDKKGTRKIAQAYLEFLYTKQGQEIAAQNYYRPRDEGVADAYRENFPELKLLTIDEAFGGWQKAHQVHFRDGGIFDEIYQ